MGIDQLQGVQNVLNNLNAQIAKISGRTYEGLVLAALEIKSDAQKLCPVVTGNLRNSAYLVAKNTVKADARFSGDRSAELSSHHSQMVAIHTQEVFTARVPEVHVGFTAFYSVYVHENPRAGKTEGVSPSGREYKAEAGSSRIVYSTVGEYKFLEKAIKNNMTKLLALIAAKAKS